MNKPKATKQLALYAVVCAGLCFSLQSLAAMLPGQFVNLLERTQTMTLDLQWKLLLLGMAGLRTVPLAAVGVWSMLTKEITRGKAMTTVVLTPILYVVGGIAVSGIQMLSARLIMTASSMEQYSAFSMAQSSMSLFGVLGTAALVLLCCAGAIELYITTHTPSDGE